MHCELNMKTCRCQCARVWSFTRLQCSNLYRCGCYASTAYVCMSTGRARYVACYISCISDVLCFVPTSCLRLPLMWQRLAGPEFARRGKEGSLAPEVMIPLLSAFPINQAGNAWFEVGLRVCLNVQAMGLRARDNPDG